MSKAYYNDDVPGWRNLGPLIAGSNKPFVRRVRCQATGTEAVLKYRSAKSGTPRAQRFYNEALQMQQLTREGLARVLPVLDIDAGEEPSWYVMPKAQLLQSAFTEAIALQQIVGHVLALAQTLGELAARGIYHRDIKPDNLFWYDGGPVLADFGIAYWGEASGTEVGEKLGPLWFMAPEMRSMSEREDGRQADVYSLAQTLSAYIHPLGVLPLPGTFRAGAVDYDLNRGWKGDHDALDALEHVLEAATRNDPDDRLSIDALAEELDLWLRAAQVTIVKNTGSLSGWGPRDDYQRDMTEVRRVVLQAVRTLASDFDDEAPVQEHDALDSEAPRWLGTYSWAPNSEDGFEPDGTLTYSIGGTRLRRLILGAVYWGREVSFIAEIQRAGDCGDQWELEASWPETSWARVRLPSASHALATLTALVARSLN
ncbi:MULTISPECIES: protein kinase domain-containing protein [Streptomyces]|uniref:protein kinase domain-containing protein n=1 Tax=Streptomyces TaxID=1883 RepID=UPI0012FF1C82|nr:protein kinase [Streptomyces durhamensis]